MLNFILSAIVQQCNSERLGEDKIEGHNQLLGVV